MPHQELKTLINDDHIKKIDTVQSLWSGYGEIARYYSPKADAYCIVKQINLEKVDAHPRGWNDDFAHQRKLSSYRNELTFYQTLAKYTCTECKVPRYIAHFLNPSSLLLVIQDLDDAGYSIRKLGLSLLHAIPTELSTVKKGLKWLANFHACFLKQDISACWSQGTYWHLKTRPNELAAMPASSLKDRAGEIDQLLYCAKYQTLLHGDAKIANFCFPTIETGADIAAVDFQYTGRGAGIIDVVYFLGSCLDDDSLERYSEVLLKHYFDCLTDANKSQINALEQEWRWLYRFAWADFARFLQGWSPEHFKLGAYANKQTELALRSLHDY